MGPFGDLTQSFLLFCGPVNCRDSYASCRLLFRTCCVCVCVGKDWVSEVLGFSLKGVLVGSMLEGCLHSYL